MSDKLRTIIREEVRSILSESAEKPYIIQVGFREYKATGILSDPKKNVKVDDEVRWTTGSSGGVIHVGIVLTASPRSIKARIGNPLDRHSKIKSFKTKELIMWKDARGRTHINPDYVIEGA